MLHLGLTTQEAAFSGNQRLTRVKQNGLHDIGVVDYKRSSSVQRYVKGGEFSISNMMVTPWKPLPMRTLRYCQPCFRSNLLGTGHDGEIHDKRSQFQVSNANSTLYPTLDGVNLNFGGTMASVRMVKDVWGLIATCGR